MNIVEKEKIAFDVETSRILEILSSEIYDSPKAFLRENVQNAYDAILMRCTAQKIPMNERHIEILVETGCITVRDDGIGMTETVLKENFWTAGSSGKKSELAQRSGVIGTFGIGAMANFGVCMELRVETRNIESGTTLISGARRDSLEIAQNCIDLERLTDEREPGTTVIAYLDPAHPVDEASACEYLIQYVRFLPVPVTVNGKLISQESFEEALSGQAAGFDEISSRVVSDGQFSGTLQVSVNGQSRLLARFTNVSLNDTPIDGEVFLVQQGGATHGYRNLFGLAPIPVSGHYGLGGFVNLGILHPTAGREALGRESIQQVARIVGLIEAEATKDIAPTDAADGNQQFQQYILAHGLVDLAHRVKISVRPLEVMVPLGDISTYEPEKLNHYYSGQDGTLLRRFASDQANLFHLSQTNPRRKLQLRYLTKIAKLPEVPEKTIVESIPAANLTLEEAIFLLRMRNILLDDYLLPEVDANFAMISHGVNVQVEKEGDGLRLSIARGIPPVAMVIETYTTAREVFGGFMKDFVREHVYPHIRDYVPSSTKQGREALFKRLKENKELFRLEESDFGGIESLLADFFAGKTDFAEVLKTSRSRASAQQQQVSREHVGSVEDELPSIIGAQVDHYLQNELEASPPIIRDELHTDMKVLTVGTPHPKLNNFQMFLALSSRMVRREGDFLRWPHTTQLVWGAHRITYIFAESTGELRLYYDIELKAPLDIDQTGGAYFPTTTIITNDRIFVPVPKNLEPAFRVVDGKKDFLIRFDTIP